ncbi:hypothetical protein J5N97_025064 [Dioscorea zingiberensis]|uniref:Pentatricopeptide repeat-containing protein n=1 Tax=Dioscorea zingiberensis TaxID=325984 RepID=A0A9D5H9H1_9LILI|nr:hypothetical protein J5N97_025064 [Dioscorea zingiberensis]
MIPPFLISPTAFSAPSTPPATLRRSSTRPSPSSSLSGLSDQFASSRAIKKLCCSPSSLPRAISLYSAIPRPDAFLCNTILRALLNSDRAHAAFAFYTGCVLPGRVSPNHFTFPLLAKLFAELGFDQTGRCVHAQAMKLGFEADLFIRNAVIHMYSCFGDIAAAPEIFGFGSRDGFGYMELDDQRVREEWARGRWGDGGCEEAVLGYAREGCCLLEHYDQWRRAGWQLTSERLAEKMTVEPAPALWGALLSAARSQSDSKLGEIVSNKLIDLEPRDMGPYVLLSNIYAEEGKWDDVERVRKVMAGNGLNKPAGVSKLECHLWSSDELSARRKNMMYSMLREMGAHLKSSCRQFERQP